MPTILININIKGEFGFREPKVSGLWRVALEADFSDQELESLRQELE